MYRLRVTRLELPVNLSNNLRLQRIELTYGRAGDVAGTVLLSPGID